MVADDSSVGHLDGALYARTLGLIDGQGLLTTGLTEPSILFLQGRSNFSINRGFSTARKILVPLLGPRLALICVLVLLIWLVACLISAGAGKE